MPKNKPIKTINGSMFKSRISERYDNVVMLEIECGTTIQFNPYYLLDLITVLQKSRHYLEENCIKGGYQNQEYLLKLSKKMQINKDSVGIKTAFGIEVAKD